MAIWPEAWTRARTELRRAGQVVALGPQHAEQVIGLCSTDPAAHVFVASRVREGDLQVRGRGLGYVVDGGLRSVVLCGANVVPVGLDQESARALAAQVLPRRARSSSVFGPRDQVDLLWQHLHPTWGPARDERLGQWSMVTSTRPSALGLTVEPGLRPARLDELDLVHPAGAAMFTEEIGYPPYQGSPQAYRAGFAHLIEQERTFVVVEDGQVLFKADVGSFALGVAQVQGVWTRPEHRGRGLASRAMAGVVEQLLTRGLPTSSVPGAPRERVGTVHLYVNEYNTGALRVYQRIGMRRTGTFATIIL